MKRFLALLVLIVCCAHQPLLAQKNWKSQDDYREGIHFGYRADFGGYKEYKGVKEFYNQKRPWLDKSLSENVWMHGFEIGLGTQSSFGGASLFNVAYSTRKDKVKGVLSNGQDFTRSVRISQFTIDPIDAWWTPIHKNGFDIGVGVMPLGVMWCRFNTKLNGEKPEFGNFKKGSFSISRAFLDMDAYSSFHLDITRRSKDANTGIRFQFFYFFGWKTDTNDMILLNQELNPSSYPNYHERTLLRNSHFGIKTLLFI